MKLFYTNLGSPYLMVALDWPRAACSVGRLGTDPEDAKTIGTILQRQKPRGTARGFGKGKVPIGEAKVTQNESKIAKMHQN